MGSTTSKRLKRVYTVYERYVNEYGYGEIPGHVVTAALSGGDEWAKVQAEWAAEDATFPWKAGDTLSDPDGAHEWLEAAPVGTVVSYLTFGGDLDLRVYEKTARTVSVPGRPAWGQRDHVWVPITTGAPPVGTEALLRDGAILRFEKVPDETPVTAE